MEQEMKKEDMLKEANDLKSLMSHLEDEYRKANVSEKYYQELSQKYTERLSELEQKMGNKETPEDAENKKEVPKPPEVKKEDKPKVGFLGKLLSKEPKPKEPKQEAPSKEDKPKEKDIEVGEVEEMTPEVIEKLAQQVAAQSGVNPNESGGSEEKTEEAAQPESNKDIEIEKLKVMIDGIRESNKTTDETIRTLSESIGELRSMVFQADGSLKETVQKLEKIEDDISEVKPKEIDKKFKETNATLENYQMQFEKIDKKTEDLSVKVNKVYDILKSIGGIENLIDLNKDIQRKVDDVKEALTYTERIATRTEKIFIDLNKSLDDITVYRAKQEGLDDAVKDLLKSVDAINVKFDNYPTKKDLESINEYITLIKKQVEEINKILPVVQTKLPESIEELKKQKEDISLFLEFSGQQFKSGKITASEYEMAKKKNLEKIGEIDKLLEKEWEKYSKIASRMKQKEENKEKLEAKQEEKKPQEVPAPAVQEQTKGETETESKASEKVSEVQEQPEKEEARHEKKVSRKESEKPIEKEQKANTAEEGKAEKKEVSLDEKKKEKTAKPKERKHSSLPKKKRSTKKSTSDDESKSKEKVESEEAAEEQQKRNSSQLSPSNPPTNANEKKVEENQSIQKFSTAENSETKTTDAIANTGVAAQNPAPVQLEDKNAEIRKKFEELILSTTSEPKESLVKKFRGMLKIK